MDETSFADAFGRLGEVSVAAWPVCASPCGVCSPLEENWDEIGLGEIFAEGLDAVCVVSSSVASRWKFVAVVVNVVVGGVVDVVVVIDAARRHFVEQQRRFEGDDGVRIARWDWRD